MSLSTILKDMTGSRSSSVDVSDLQRVQVGLIGRGIGASLTPAMHRKEGQRLGLDYGYILIDFDVLGLADADLSTVVATARELGFAGLNVTFPFKQQILRSLDELSADARGIGAVNTVVFEGNRSVGHNTDCWGFAEAFRTRMSDVSISHVLQLGAGGAGAAVAEALLGLGVGHLTLFDVDSGKAQELALQLNGRFSGRVSITTDANRACDRVDGVVNSTPVGMTKLPGMPLDPSVLRQNHWYADIIYFPRETELLRAARNRGCRVMPGAGMAIFQAVKAFELFSGVCPDPAQMAATFEAEASVT